MRAYSIKHAYLGHVKCKVWLNLIKHVSNEHHGSYHVHRLVCLKREGCIRDLEPRRNGMIESCSCNLQHVFTLSRRKDLPFS